MHIIVIINSIILYFYSLISILIYILIKRIWEICISTFRSGQPDSEQVTNRSTVDRSTN